jgi:hypothetical protein
MTGKGIYGITIALILCTLGTLLHMTAQDNRSGTSFLTPTPVVFPPPNQSAYPELICPYFVEAQSGYTWRGITIGESVQDDLESVLEQIGRYEMVLSVEGALANSIGYRWRDSREEGIVRHAPAQIDVCFQDS